MPNPINDRNIKFSFHIIYLDESISSNDVASVKTDFKLRGKNQSRKEYYYNIID